MRQSPRNKWMRRFEEIVLQRPEMADKRIDWQEAIALHTKGLTEIQAAKEYKKPSEIYKSKLLTVGGIL